MNASHVYNGRMPTVKTGTRRRPVQARSQARVERILDAATAIVARAGLIRPETEPVAAELAVELGDRVFECAYRRDPGVEGAIFTEGKRAITAYLSQHAP